MSKHTQGPWAVRDIPTGQRYIGPSQDGGAPSVALVLSRVNVPDERLAADARLIAAAPELLEFAQEVRRTGDTRLASMAIAVIAKATGEQQGPPQCLPLCASRPHKTPRLRLGLLMCLCRGLWGWRCEPVHPPLAQHLGRLGRCNCSWPHRRLACRRWILRG